MHSLKSTSKALLRLTTRSIPTFYSFKQRSTRHKSSDSMLNNEDQQPGLVTTGLDWTQTMEVKLRKRDRERVSVFTFKCVAINFIKKAH